MEKGSAHSSIRKRHESAELKLKEEEMLFDKSRNRGRGSGKKTGQAVESKETTGLLRTRNSK